MIDQTLLPSALPHLSPSRNAFAGPIMLWQNPANQSKIESTWKQSEGNLPILAEKLCYPICDNAT
jgi:hypothetical protein